MKNSAISERKNQSISRGVGMTTQIYADRAENSEIWDVEGRRYVDFSSGIAVVNTGHRHPKVIAAVKAQLDRFTHTCHQVVPYESYVRLAERLNGKPAPRFAESTDFSIELIPEDRGTRVRLTSAQVPASRAMGVVMKAFGRREIEDTLRRSLDALERQVSAG